MVYSKYKFSYFVFQVHSEEVSYDNDTQVEEELIVAVPPPPKKIRPTSSKLKEISTMVQELKKNKRHSGERARKRE